MSVTTKKMLPQANGDFYAVSSTLSEEDQALLFLPLSIADFVQSCAL
jgi:hypothetical protein